MQDPHIEFARQGPVARITLARPERHNALGRHAVAEFRAHLEQIAADTSIRVLLLTGAGNRTFCSGASLDEIEQGEMSGELFDGLASHLAALPQPSLCALNGDVFGGGAELALCCDFRIGVEGMRLQVPAARIGLCYPLNGLVRYVNTLGLDLARRILVGAEEIDAPELLRAGYLHRIVPTAQLASIASTEAERLATLAPLATRTMKQLLGASAGGTLDRPAALARIAACNASSDLREGLAARRERRAPQFRGE